MLKKKNIEKHESTTIGHKKNFFIHSKIKIKNSGICKSKVNVNKISKKKLKLNIVYLQCKQLTEKQQVKNLGRHEHLHLHILC